MPKGMCPFNELFKGGGKIRKCCFSEQFVLVIHFKMPKILANENLIPDNFYATKSMKKFTTPRPKVHVGTHSFKGLHAFKSYLFMLSF